MTHIIVTVFKFMLGFTVTVGVLGGPFSLLRACVRK